MTPVEVLTAALSVIALTAAVYAGRNAAVVANYRAAVQSQDARIAALERDNSDLRGEVERLKEREARHRDAGRLLMEAALLAGVCGREDCPRREPPPAAGF